MDARADSLHTTEAARKRLKKRYGFEARFKFFGMMAIAFAALALVALLSTIVVKAVGALTESYFVLDVNYDRAAIDPKNTRDPKIIRRGEFTSLVRAALRKALPTVTARRDKLKLYALLSDGAALEMRAAAMSNPDLIGTSGKRDLLASDDADLWLKGYYGKLEPMDAPGVATPGGTTGRVKLFVTSNAFAPIMTLARAHLEDKARLLRLEAANAQRGIDVYTDRLKSVTNDGVKAQLERDIEGYKARRKVALEGARNLDEAVRSGKVMELNSDLASFFVRINGGVIKVQKLTIDSIEGDVLLPLSSTDKAAAGNWQLLAIKSSESARRVSDKQVIWLEKLRGDGAIKQTFNWRFFSAGDSREAELAGILGALAGTFWTMVVTFFVSFPIGVLAAIYLEEFASKNALTHFIEVNINNLAAVPSIVFGLLGLAIFLNVFGVPRSAPLAGGLVLALMTLPTIIIAARAAIKAVPPSIREAALGVGASKVQTVFHHVLPLAMPGILTGAIIGMAQALGETAPLLLIGMVAFIRDVPSGILSDASVLPVQIYRWADFPERAFEMRTALAILVLLAFLILMNALAVLLRKRFERRW